MLETRNLPLRDPRGDLLRELSGRCADYRRHCAGGALAGQSVANLDLRTLNDLARRLADDLANWSGLVDRLDLAATARFDSRRAGTLVLENVFDEILERDAWSVLRAALDLAQSQ